MHPFAKRLAAFGLFTASLTSAAMAAEGTWRIPTGWEDSQVMQTAGARRIPGTLPQVPPDGTARVGAPANSSKELADAGLLLPGAPSESGRLVPQAIDHSYPAESIGLYDNIGSHMTPEELGPQSRPVYPYGAKRYWDGHDADPESWGDLMELPHVKLGWFANAELTYANPYVSAAFDSGPLLEGPFPGNPVTLGAADLDWTVMPKLELGYRYEHGLGELRTAYRYLSAQGQDPLPAFDTGGLGTLNTRLQLHVLDMDLNILEFNPEGLPLIMPLLLAPGRLGLGRPIVKGVLDVPLEYRMYFGIRAATMYYESRGQGDILQEQVVNNFSGAGLHFGWDMNQRLPISAPLFLHLRAEGSGIFGIMEQRFTRTQGGVTANGIHDSDGIGVPTVDIEVGLSWVPKWPDRNTRFLVAYRYEEWFSWADSGTSNAEMFLNGILLRGEYKF